uniref:Uncharacterized protein n=1 Tax=Rhizophora mucronata TaxID=61149 RepID=A0A2P2N5Y1_RHIMU
MYSLIYNPLVFFYGLELLLTFTILDSVLSARFGFRP